MTAEEQIVEVKRILNNWKTEHFKDIPGHEPECCILDLIEDIEKNALSVAGCTGKGTQTK